MKQKKLFFLVVVAALGCVSLPSLAQVKIQSQWDGAKVAFLGDSITDERQLASQDIYWHQLADILGIQPYCYGISGNRTAHIKGQAQKLLAQHGQDVDAIIIFIGTNDYNNEVPLGEWFTEEYAETVKDGEKVLLRHRTPVMGEKTMRSEINGFMSYLKHNFPTKQIILLTPIHRAFFDCSATNIQPDENWSNLLGLFVDDYINVIKETANVWAVPVIDLNSICGLYPLETAHQAYYRESKRTSDDQHHDLLHPNTDGHMRMALAIAYQLLGYPASFPKL